MFSALVTKAGAQPQGLCENRARFLGRTLAD
jgi:hypothetical protein